MFDVGVSLYEPKETLPVLPFRREILPLADHWDWQSKAKCISLPSEIFFHPDAERGEFRRNREIFAKNICGQCPVLFICREFALVGKETYGIWGGLSADERLEIIDSRKILNRRN